MLEQIDQQAQRLMWEVRQQTLQLMTKNLTLLKNQCQGSGDDC